MPLLIGAHPTLDEVVAELQAWAAQVDGINAAERLTQLAGGLASVPTAQPGFLQPYAGSSAPSGWLMCDGSAISRTQYANLFAVIGVTYGVGDNVTTFNIPDLRRRFPMGKSSSDTLGGTGGSFDHTHTGGTVSGSTASESAHTHGAGSYVTPTHNHNGITAASASSQEVQAGAGEVVAHHPHQHDLDTQAAMSISGTSGAGSAHSHSAGTLAVGASGSANPPYVAVNYIIKT